MPFSPEDFEGQTSKDHIYGTSKYNGHLGSYEYTYPEYTTVGVQWPSYQDICTIREQYYNQVTGAYEYRDVRHNRWGPHQRPQHRANPVLVKTDAMHTVESTWRKILAPVYRFMTDAEILHAVMTNKNSTSDARREQAAVQGHLGYGGPVGGAEARSLRNIMSEIGKADHVLRGHAIKCVTRTINVPIRGYSKFAAINTWYKANPNPAPGVTCPVPTKSVTRTWDMLVECYVFKSPIDSIPWTDFIRLARAYRTDKGGLRRAISTLLADPSKAAEVLDAVNTIDVLANLL